MSFNYLHTTCYKNYEMCGHFLQNKNESVYVCVLNKTVNIKYM